MALLRRIQEMERSGNPEVSDLMMGRIMRISDSSGAAARGVVWGAQGAEKIMHLI